MKQESLSDREFMDEFYKKKEFQTVAVENTFTMGAITEREKFRAAKQILLGLAILYVITLLISIMRPEMATQLLDMSKTMFPPIATLILVKYFQERWN